MFWRSAEQSLGFGLHVLNREAEFLQIESWRKDLKAVRGGRLDPIGIILPGIIDDCSPIWTLSPIMQPNFDPTLNLFLPSRS